MSFLRIPDMAAESPPPLRCKRIARKRSDARVGSDQGKAFALHHLRNRGPSPRPMRAKCSGDGVRAAEKSRSTFYDVRVTGYHPGHADKDPSGPGLPLSSGKQRVRIGEDAWVKESREAQKLSRSRSCCLTSMRAHSGSLRCLVASSLQKPLDSSSLIASTRSTRSASTSNARAAIVGHRIGCADSTQRQTHRGFLRLPAFREGNGRQVQEVVFSTNLCHAQ